MVKIWKFELFPTQQIVGMTPTQDITLGSGSAGMQVITVDNMEINQAPQPTVDLTTQVYDSNFPTPYGNFKVALQAAPDNHDKNLQDFIQVSLSSTDIINSYQAKTTANNTDLVFSPGAQPAQVTAGPNSVFNISFVYGQSGDKYGFGALATIDQAKQFLVTRLSNASGWQIAPNLSAQNPSWDLIPPDGAPIIGSGSGSTVSFDIANIITTYQPGPTVMLLTYKDIPGYQPGVYTILLNKIAHVVISDFTVKPNPTYVQSNGKAPVTVSWNVEHATQLTLTQNYSQKDVTGKTCTDADLEAQQTTFTLTAEGPLADKGNQASCNQTAIALPVINSFIGAPTDIYYAEASHEAAFSWAVETVGSGQVELNSTGNAFGGGSSVNPIGSASSNLTGPQMITLSPKGVNNPLALTRNLVISAFKTSLSSYIAGTSSHGIAASPGAPFIAVSDSDKNQVVILGTVQFSQNNTVTVGNKPAALAFSADGSIMVVANTGDNSLTPVEITLTGGSPVFSPQAPVALNGTPQSILVSPDGSNIYVVVDMGSATGQLVALKKTNAGYHTDSSVGVGNAPRGLAAIPSGAVFYVANSGAESVSIIGISANGKLLPGSTISQVGTKPTGVAVGSDNSLLLVTCAGDNSVIAVDLDHPNTGSRNSIAVGTNPGAIAITPSGSYAFICNTGDNTLSMLDCWGGVNDVKVVGSPIALGDQPVAVTVTSDGLNVLTADGASGKISLLTLATYKAAGNAVTIGDRMTNVAVSPDTSQVFVWQNPLLGNATTPGIIAYATASASLQSLMSTDNVISCCYSPDASRLEAYALVYNDDQLYTIDTKTLKSTATKLPLPSNDYQTLALGISGDGDNLFLAITDNSNNLSLLVMEYKNNAWQLLQLLALYQANAKPGLILVESSIDGQSVVIVDPHSQIVHFVSKDAGCYQLNSKTVTAQSAARGITMLPNAATAYILNSAGMEHDITVIDMASLTSKLVTIPQSYVALTSIVSAPDGRRLYACDANAAALRILDPGSLRILQTIPLSSGGGQPVQNPFALAISSDATSLYVVNNSSKNMSIVEQQQMQ